MKTPVFLLALLVHVCMANGQTQIGADIVGEAEGDHAGVSVSLSADGGRLAVGALFNDGVYSDPGANVGQVRVYEYAAGDWVLLGDAIDGEALMDWSGFSISLSADGHRVAIGAPLNDEAGGSSGHVRVYEYSEEGWRQLGDDIDGEFEGDQSGFSVSLSADGARVAIGAPFNNGAGPQPDAGHVRVYAYMGNEWVQLGDDIDGDAFPDQSGRAVSLSADGARVAIGSPFNADAGPDAGKVRIYAYEQESWKQLGSDIAGAAERDLFGASVALSADGARVAVGAPFHDHTERDAGQARIYEYNDGAWRQVGDPIDGAAAGQLFGITLSMSADGNRLAVGAPLHEGLGAKTGQVRIFEYMDGQWRQIGENIDGEAAGDQLGDAVSLSADGRRVAVGSPLRNSNGPFAGQVRVYGDLQVLTNETDILKKAIEIYPNPSAGSLTIRGCEGQDVLIRIFDSRGAMIREFPISQAEIDLSGLPTGIFFLFVSTPAGAIVKKIVVR